VTHLAQIAAWADRHYVLRKRTRGASTIVELVALEEGRPVLEEIARMLSGSTTGVALDHADALVRDVRATKARASKRPARAVAGGAG
jgi:DNA repair protein RecN (Recombination protein N)